MNTERIEGSLARKIWLRFALASIVFLTTLSLLVHYSNEELEYALLEEQVEDELAAIRDTLSRDKNPVLPSSANLKAYLKSQVKSAPIPSELADLPPGVYHDMEINGRDYHLVIEILGSDTVFLLYDITEIEDSENLLSLILAGAWLTMIIMVTLLARALSRNLAQPIERLSHELGKLDPNQRGIQLGQNFADDEVGRIARAFDQYSKRLDSFVEKQQAFSAMASHELRSPMTIIQTSSDLIDFLQPNAETHQQIEKIQRAVRVMNDTIEALLKITRDEADDIPTQPIKLHDLVEEIIELLQPELVQRQVQVSNRIDPGASVEINRVLGMVVCTNLLKNAVKHGGDNSITIEWQNPALSIVDTGSGIDVDDLPHIFDFAMRGQRSQGYGIGLYVSKLICDHQGWQLELAPSDQGIRASIHFNALAT